ncbi:MAG: radical SAM protein [Moorellales bacterium]
MGNAGNPGKAEAAVNPTGEEVLAVREIFLSLQGESTSAGLPTVFVRFSGCNLRCRYCDTRYAYQGGFFSTPESLLALVSAYPFRRVCLTGGEPLLQPAATLQRLLERLEGWEVSIETNGSLPLEVVKLAPGQRWVMDLKTPGSGEVEANRWENLELLSPQDEIKFVLTSREDYLWAREIIRRYDLTRRARVLLSPAWGELNPRELAHWMLADGLDARLQLQLHKLIFGPEGEGGGHAR